MTRGEYWEHVLNTYRLVSVLSDKNDGTVYRLRHKEKAQDIILRSFAKPVPAYDVLCGIVCEALPRVYDAVTLEDGQMVWEEWIDGLTVAEVMETGKYRYRGARRVLTAVCHALTVLHERGIIHRDVKPENVMVDKHGRVVLIDLNVSRQVSAASRDTVIMGTVGYASPEQLGLAQSDARTDVYAVGILLNVMVTGKHPGEQLAKGYAGRIVKKCTQLSPDDRYPTAAALCRALHSIFPVY
ncbi:MAG: serine/threonine protein kinase [Clostridia bacterium]|nr:serine/threonine protein kinase [Clostridia bacterium]